jgi:hypothetical protein
MVLMLACIGIYSKCQRKPVVESVERDTVVVYDTITHYYPKPVEVEKVRTEYKFLTRVQPVGKTDTLLQHDSVLVEVPITSKHYGCKDYDAWVSGFEPSLDSIKVYRETQYITERVTISKPPNKWELDAAAGIDYNSASQRYTPYAGGELMYKPSRLQVGIRGGVIKNGKAESFAGAVIRYRLY